MTFLETNDSPIFLPRFMDGKIEDYQIPITHALIDLSHIKWRPSILENISKMTTNLMVDPVTHKAFFADSKEKENFKEIGYPQVEPEILYSEKTIRKEFIQISIQEQIKAGASVLIAPYLFSPDTDDTKFSINLTLLSETILYLEENKITLPLYAKLCLGLSVLSRLPVINHIYSRYCDDYSDKIEGVIIGIDEFDARKMEIQHLLGYANLVHLMGSRLKVICAPIGNFGEILIALSANAFGSSINIGEGFSTKGLESGTGGNGNTHNRVYIPEIMGSLNYEQARNIEYKSESAESKIDFSVGDPDSENKNKHYILSKIAEAKALQGKTREEKIQYMLNRVENAKKLLDSYIIKYAWKLDSQYLAQWSLVLKKALSWSDPSVDEEELEGLLKELDNSND